MTGGKTESFIEPFEGKITVGFVIINNYLVLNDIILT